MTRFSLPTAVPRRLLAVAVLLLAASTSPAHATAGRDAIPGNWLQLSVTTGNSQSSDTRGTLLMCNPPQGHAHAKEACAQLAAAHGDINAIPVDTGAICNTLYAPVVASARGVWDGRRVEYRKEFSNACVMKAHTGAVFELDK